MEKCICKYSCEILFYLMSSLHRIKFFNVSNLNKYEGHLETKKERFAIQRYLLIIGNKKNMQVL